MLTDISAAYDIPRSCDHLDSVTERSAVCQAVTDSSQRVKRGRGDDSYYLKGEKQNRDSVRPTCRRTTSCSGLTESMLAEKTVFARAAALQRARQAYSGALSAFAFTGCLVQCFFSVSRPTPRSAYAWSEMLGIDSDLACGAAV